MIKTDKGQIEMRGDIASIFADVGVISTQLGTPVLRAECQKKWQRKRKST